MDQNRSYPLGDARYGTAYTASLGMFDTAGWTPPAAGEYAGFDVNRRDYGPKGFAGIVLGVLAFVVLTAVVVGVALLIGAL